MSENHTSEKVIHLPLFDEAAAQLKEDGTFQKDLTGQDVAGIMRGVTEQLVSGRQDVRVSIASMSVSIERDQGKVSGAVKVDKPINATIGINCVLGNDSHPGKIKLNHLDVSEDAGFFERAALKIVNTREECKQY